MNILVLFGDSASLGDYYSTDWKCRDTNDIIPAIEKALTALGHTVLHYDVDLELFEKLKQNKDTLDLVFNLCDDGFFANPKLEPHVPALLDIFKIPYTGNDYLSLALCLDKGIAKRLLLSHNILTPAFQIFYSEHEKLDASLKFPLIVKPLHEDASIGIHEDSVVHDEISLRKKVS